MLRQYVPLLRLDMTASAAHNVALPATPGGVPVRTDPESR
jgi:hypothetical protein